MTLATVALSCAKQIGRASADGTTIVDLETEIKEQIAEAVRFYNRKPWHLTELRNGTLTTATSTTWYSTIDVETNGAGDQDLTGRTSVDVNSIVNLIYMRENPGPSGLNEPLDMVSYLDFERMFEGSTPQGTPTYYTKYAGQIGIWPTPDGAYTIYLSANIKPIVPTDDADDSVWFTQANELIEAAALKRVCLKYLRDTERAAEFAAIELEAVRQFQTENMLKTSTGRIRPAQ